MVETAKRKSKSKTRVVADAPRQPDATSLRGRVPALSPRQADALRGFFATPQRWYLPDGGVLRLAPAPVPGDGEIFQIEAEGTRLALSLRTGVARSGDGLQWSDYTGRSRTLAWSLAHEPQLMRLSEALGASLLPIAPHGPPPADRDAEHDDAVWLGFAIEDTQRGPDQRHADSPLAPCLGELRLPLAWLERMTRRSGPLYDDEAPVPLGRWSGLPAPVSLRFAGPQLRGEQWRRLQPGDVLVIGTHGRFPPVHAHVAGRRWPLAVATDGWRVDGAAQSADRGADDTRADHLKTNPSQETRMTETDSDDAATAQDSSEGQAVDAAAGKRDLPVQLDFELGRTELSVGELAGLQPGYVFALPSHLEGANVSIRANGQAVGRGEVVAVGDTLGVRLLAWS